MGKLPTFVVEANAPAVLRKDAFAALNTAPGFSLNSPNLEKLRTGVPLRANAAGHYPATVVEFVWRPERQLLPDSQRTAGRTLGCMTARVG